jgi:hypothetical protein
MTANPRIFRNAVFESGSKFPRARLTDRNDDVLTQSSFGSSVTLNVYDLSSSTPTTAVFATTRTMTNVVSNSLQTWTLDSDGYNFSDTITSNEVAWEGGHTFRVCYLLTHTTEGLFPVVFEVRCEPLIGA